VRLSRRKKHFRWHSATDTSRCVVGYPSQGRNKIQTGRLGADRTRGRSEIEIELDERHQCIPVDSPALTAGAFFHLTSGKRPYKAAAHVTFREVRYAPIRIPSHTARTTPADRFPTCWNVVGGWRMLTCNLMAHGEATMRPIRFSCTCLARHSRLANADAAGSF
jgi:hypothetical protein